ncbi:hypothetical protein [Ruegeria sp. MALMAid1280]|uniref:hypothetical protein n=1 Tax=Ruegeria sp. MALMAid1280 TaxID=3411634 RepID=UPI003B9FB5A2
MTVSTATAPTVTLDPVDSSTVTNDGTVSATANATAIGLLVDTRVLPSGQIVNNGAISATVAGATSNATAFSFLTNGDFGGTFQNTGTLSANAATIADNAVAVGAGFGDGV